jgi:hypothetical protein
MSAVEWRDAARWDPCEDFWREGGGDGEVRGALARLEEFWRGELDFWGLAKRDGVRGEVERARLEGSFRLASEIEWKGPLEVAEMELRQLRMRSAEGFLALPRLREARRFEAAAAVEEVLVRVVMEPLRPRSFLEKTEPLSQSSGRRFWNAQSCRKTLICPV